jgi:hypothetical protein
VSATVAPPPTLSPRAQTAVLFTFGTGRDTGDGYLVLAYLLFGAGVGLVGAPITNPALAELPRDQAPVAGAIGVAVCGSILASSAAGFVSASHAAWAVLVGCGAELSSRRSSTRAMDMEMTR